MATHGKGHDWQTATLVMAMQDKGDNGQIAGVRGNGDVRQDDSLRRECNDGQIVPLVMATCSNGNDGQVANACNGHTRQR
jgi:hypothetical protein